MAEGLIIEITHTGTTNSSLLLSDIDDGVDYLGSFRKSGPVYVPVNSTVQLVYTASVALSFESGVIRGLINGGQITARVVSGDALTTAIWGASTGGSLDIYINGTTGDDTNAGTSSTAPVKTWGRVLELIPRPIVNETVTVYFQGTSFDCDVNDDIDLDSVSTIGNGTLTLKGTSTLVGTGSLTDNNPQSDGWAIEDTARTFTSADVGRVIKFTSGVYANSYFMIAKLISANVVRLCQPDYAAPFYVVGDTYELYNINTLIQGTTYPGCIRRGGVYTGGNLANLRLSLEDLKTLGGVRLANCSLDAKRVVFHEGNPNPYTFRHAIWATLCDVMMNASAAIPVGASPANATGVQLFFCRLRDSDLSYTFTYCAICGVGWTDNAVYLWGCSGNLTSIAGMDNHEITIKRTMGHLVCNILATDNLELDIADDAENFIEVNRIYAFETKITVRDASLRITGYGAFTNSTVDCNGATDIGFYILRGSTVILGGGGTLTVTGATAAGIDLSTGSTLITTSAVRCNSNGAQGILAQDSTIITEAGTLTLSSNTGDGIAAYQTRGNIKINSNNNGGWGLQSLEGSILRNNASSFAANGSGPTNVDADSKWI